ncbi:hypothetical protein MXD62_21055, partial [Frankia sp. Mgl5]|uniref:hypothetical protein n=1 Tax=Frankia sp. Mgl5 TaxID=2933793 RepID=UPI00200D3AF0
GPKRRKQHKAGIVRLRRCPRNGQHLKLTTWIRLDRPTLTLQPGASAPITATITVPHDASPGERYAGIWAETTTADPTQGANVVQVSRVGVRVYLAVGPGGPPAADFTIDTLTPTRLPDGRRAVIARVRNTGGRALDLNGELTLTDGPAGLNAGPFPAQLGTTLARGQSEPVTIPLDQQIPGGPWKALIHLKSGITDRTAHATITLPGQPGTVTPTKTTSIVIRALIIGAALVTLAALAWGLLRRRNRRSTEA